MPKFVVHLRPTLNVRVVEVEANSYVEAIEKSERVVDDELHRLFTLKKPTRNIQRIGIFDEATEALVDVVCDDSHKKTLKFSYDFEIDQWTEAK